MAAGLQPVPAHGRNPGTPGLGSRGVRLGGGSGPELASGRSAAVNAFVSHQQSSRHHGNRSAIRTPTGGSICSRRSWRASMRSIPTGRCRSAVWGADSFQNNHHHAPAYDKRLTTCSASRTSWIRRRGPSCRTSSPFLCRRCVPEVTSGPDRSPRRTLAWSGCLDPETGHVRCICEQSALAKT